MTPTAKYRAGRPKEFHRRRLIPIPASPYESLEFLAQGDNSIWLVAAVEFAQGFEFRLKRARPTTMLTIELGLFDLSTASECRRAPRERCRKHSAHRHIRIG